MLSSLVLYLHNLIVLLLPLDYKQVDSGKDIVYFLVSNVEIIYFTYQTLVIMKKLRKIKM